MNPLPTLAPPGISVSWSGSDPGSGIQDYDVWVFQDGITMTSWLTDTTLERAVYAGEKGTTYGFSVAARDRAGNENLPPTQPQVITTVGNHHLFVPALLRNTI